MNAFVRRLVLYLSAAAALAAADRVSVAAAANLVYALQVIDPAFRATEPGTTVVTTIAASGNLVAQIRNGAPFDVFLSADLDYPRALVASGDAAADTLTPFAVGRLVVWTMRPELDLGSVGGLMRNPAVRKVALAQPETAPYGRAAREALSQLGVWSAVQAKIVTGDSVSQAAQFVQTGNADCGFVALSLVVSPPLAGQGRYLEVPRALYAPITQAAVLTTFGRNNAAARRYLAFLTSPTAREILARFGYGPPTAGPAAPPALPPPTTAPSSSSAGFGD